MSKFDDSYTLSKFDDSYTLCSNNNNNNSSNSTTAAATRAYTHNTHTPHFFLFNSIVVSNFAAAVSQPCGETEGVAEACMCVCVFVCVSVSV